MPAIELPANGVAAAGTACSGCGLMLAPALLACPRCQALVHRAKLEQLAAEAERAGARGDWAEAMSCWRRALPLLPENSKQHAQITQTIVGLRERVAASTPGAVSAAPRASADAGSPSEPRPTGWGRVRALLASTVALVVFKLKSIWLLLLAGWKPLLLGLTKLGTLSSMLLSLGVYWKAFGLQFALGLVGCIYVHEIGHVVALKRLGIAATSPMFIPGFGAVVRLQQYPIDAVEEAQVGLAGPRWGLGISAVVFAVGWLTHSAALGAIATTSAWINLFNLIPIAPLDGGRGFRALSSRQRFIAAVLLGAGYAVTQQGMLGIVALVSLFRSFEQRPNDNDNLRVMIEYVVLALALGVLAAVPR